MKPGSTLQIEPRWPVALTIMGVMWLLRVLPDRIRFFPVWIQFIFGMMLLASMLAVRLMDARPRWLRIEYIVLLVFCSVTGVLTLANLIYLIRVMIYRSTELGGLQLFTSSIGVWITNVLTFSLLYWRFDLGGPEERVHLRRTRPDWLFPQEQLSEEQWSNWKPTYVDYLFLAFTTATAFSPTDTLPLTTRAKLVMMLEIAISLMTLVVVAARAINILGT
jgi:hypothetical protein